MSTSGQSKLSKKQKKGLAFRQRQKSKTVGDLPQPDLLDDDENNETDVHDVDDGALIQSHDRKPKGKGKSTVSEETRDPSTTRKRKSKETDVAEQADDGARPVKKAKRSPDDAGEDEADGSGRGQVKARYILFVGNLKYSTSKESILKHFAVCDPPPTVRLLTPKAGTATKSKGCAFLEFKHRNALLQALKLHQSELEGRKINVELTAGGGGKSETRLGKIQQRNKNLASERTKRSGVKGSNEAETTEIERPQRHSKTSGLDAPVLKKRTWTIGDNGDGQPHRGGNKRRNQKQRISKNFGSGANLIPIG